MTLYIRMFLVIISAAIWPHVQKVQENKNLKTIIVTDELVEAPKAFKKHYDASPEDMERHRKSSEQGDLAFTTAMAWAINKIATAIFQSAESEEINV